MGRHDSHLRSFVCFFSMSIATVSKSDRLSLQLQSREDTVMQNDCENELKAIGYY